MEVLRFWGLIGWTSSAVLRIMDNRCVLQPSSGNSSALTATVQSVMLPDRVRNQGILGV